MNCCQCQGIEELFSQTHVSDEILRYHTKGPDKTTRMLTEALIEAGVDSLTDLGFSPPQATLLLVAVVRHILDYSQEL